MKNRLLVGAGVVLLGTVTAIRCGGYASDGQRELTGATLPESRACESLKNLKLTDTIVTAAQTVAAGAFVPPGASAPPAWARFAPAFCRVTATIKPTQDSDIGIEVWMPGEGWNGRFRGQGNGGFGGEYNYVGAAVALMQHYAAATTDTGHMGAPADARWARGRPEKIVDFGYRAIHEMTIEAKQIIRTFYGKPPEHAYFSACSNGGRQALMEAQRFPADYDGVIAGAPANYWTQVFATFLWNMQATQSDPASYIPAAKIPAIAAGVVAACDAQDGVKDGILADPRACHVRSATLVCRHGDAGDCLTPAQAAALDKIYAGPHTTAGQRMFPGFMPGGEDGRGGWSLWITGPSRGKDLETAFASGFFDNMISADTPLDLKTVNIEAAVKLANERQGRNLNADDSNLRPFVSRGGKLILYHGWCDAALPPLATIDYFEAVRERLGPELSERSVRLYMVPGMQHCGGGPGADSFGQGRPEGNAQHDIGLALEQWVETGIAPGVIVSTKHLPEGDAARVGHAEPGNAGARGPSGIAMTRPLCPYPKVVRYKGSGDARDASAFVCEQAPK